MLRHALWIPVLVVLGVAGTAGAQQHPCTTVVSDNVRNPRDVCSSSPGDHAHLQGFRSGFMTCPLGFSGGGSTPFCHHGPSGTDVTSYVSVRLPRPSPTGRISVAVGNFRDSCTTHCDYVQAQVYTCTSGRPITYLGYVSVVGADRFRTQTFTAPGHDCVLIGRWGGGNAYPNVRLYFVTEAM